MLATSALLVLAALACVSDLVYQRIPNTLTLGSCVLAFALAFATADVSGMGRSVAGALAGAAVFFPLYALGGMGAGDVKLMGAAGAFLGPAGALLAAGLGLVAGAVMATAVVAFRVLAASWQVTPGMREGLSAAGRAKAAFAVVRKERFPYAVAIAVGIVAALWVNSSLGSFLLTLSQR